ncbi:MAG: biotin/lipoate A/B protein ligase family protein [Microcoleaceae cyanobacterium]
MTNPTWRLIPLLSASGRLQMAIDGWLLEQHRLGLHPPTLRFYTWDPAAISLGYHQRRWPECWQDLTWQGKPLEIVRRPSGGRAVLHQGDLTYAVITSGLSQRRIIAYQQICQFLIAGWQRLGYELQYGSAQRNYIHNPNCFGTATGADLVLPNGSKLIGSAQLRRDEAILQHGSMAINIDPTLYQQVFQQPAPISILSNINQSDFLPTIITALIEAARHCFEIEFEIQPLSDAELQSLGV